MDLGRQGVNASEFGAVDLSDKCWLRRSGFVSKPADDYGWV